MTVVTPAEAFPGERPVTQAVVAEHKLNETEYTAILALLGRTPTLTELGIFSALWSEHCSYKHTKPVLRRFPVEGPQVVQGPGENAGVLRLPEGWAVAFKIESHNHPSAVEPYPGRRDRRRRHPARRLHHGGPAGRGAQFAPTWSPR